MDELLLDAITGESGAFNLNPNLRNGFGGFVVDFLGGIVVVVVVEGVDGIVGVAAV